MQDNPSLYYAYHNFWRVIPVLVIPDKANTHIGGEEQEMGIYRRQFLLEAANSLRDDLAAKGIDLIILRGNKDLPDRLYEICQAHNIMYTVTSYPRGTYEGNLLGELCEFTAVFTCEDDCLINVDDLPFELDSLPHVFSSFRKKVERRLKVRPISELPEFKSYQNRYKFGDPLEESQHELHPNTAYPLKGGEKAAHERLNYYLWESEHITSYKKTRNGLIGKDYSSKLSAYLALGNISPVQVYHAIKAFEKEVTKNDSTYWLIFELLWREYFLLVAEIYQIQIYELGGIQKRKLEFENDAEKFEAWCTGNTSHPFINANMKELVATGYLSNRGRQNVASYLVHHLKVDWRWGASFFEKHLIDYDISVNWCNWMYLAGVGNDPRNRVFNPELQQNRYDPKGKYIEMWEH